MEFLIVVLDNITKIYSGKEDSNDCRSKWKAVKGVILDNKTKNSKKSFSYILRTFGLIHLNKEDYLIFEQIL